MKRFPWIRSFVALFLAVILIFTGCCLGIWEKIINRDFFNTAFIFFILLVLCAAGILFLVLKLAAIFPEKDEDEACVF